MSGGRTNGSRRRGRRDFLWTPARRPASSKAKGVEPRTAKSNGPSAISSYTRSAAAKRPAPRAARHCIFRPNGRIDAAQRPRAPEPMVFWTLAIALTVLACAALYYAAAGRAVNAGAGDAIDAISAHHRLQLSEIEADIAAGRLGEAEGDRGARASWRAKCCGCAARRTRSTAGGPGRMTGCAVGGGGCGDRVGHLRRDGQPGAAGGAAGRASAAARGHEPRAGGGADRGAADGDAGRSCAAGR